MRTPVCGSISRSFDTLPGDAGTAHSPGAAASVGHGSVNPMPKGIFAVWNWNNAVSALQVILP